MLSSRNTSNLFGSMLAPASLELAAGELLLDYGVDGFNTTAPANTVLRLRSSDRAGQQGRAVFARFTNKTEALITVEFEDGDDNWVGLSGSIPPESSALFTKVADHQVLTFVSGSVVGGASVDLGFQPSPTTGRVLNSGGQDAFIPLVTGTNSGLMSPGHLAAISAASLLDVSKAASSNNVDLVYGEFTRITAAAAEDTVTIPTSTVAGSMIGCFNGTGVELNITLQAGGSFFGSPSLRLPANSSFIARVVAANTIAILGQDTQVATLLGSGTNIVNDGTVTISQTWASLAAKFREVRFRVKTNGYDFERVISTTGWTDGTKILLAPDGASVLALANMDSAGTTATYKAGLAFATATSIEVFGVK